MLCGLESIARDVEELMRAELDRRLVVEHDDAAVAHRGIAAVRRQVADARGSRVALREQARHGGAARLIAVVVAVDQRVMRASDADRRRWNAHRVARRSERAGDRAQGGADRFDHLAFFGERLFLGGGRLGAGRRLRPRAGAQEIGGLLPRDRPPTVRMPPFTRLKMLRLDSSFGPA
jgi:hypothetical protein